MTVKILIIDDEESICEILKYNLEKEGFDVDCAYSAEEALTLDIASYSLCIVDIMMDTMSGYDFLKRLRNNTATERVPVIFCSALNGEDDTVMGLNIGADDYITKPFVISEVIARVRAVLRRYASAPAAPYMAAGMPVATPAMPTPNAPKSSYEPDVTFKTLRLDRNEKVCYLNNEPIHLTRKEFDLLLFFLTHRNRIYSRNEIISQVWSGDVVTNRTVDTNLTRLRNKIGEYSANISTRLGFGYGFFETV